MTDTPSLSPSPEAQVAFEKAWDDAWSEHSTLDTVSQFAWRRLLKKHAAIAIDRFAAEQLAEERDQAILQRDVAMAVIEAGRQMCAQIRYVVGIPDGDPHKGSGNRLADALAAYDAARPAEPPAKCRDAPGAEVGWDGACLICWAKPGERCASPAEPPVEG